MNVLRNSGPGQGSRKDRKNSLFFIFVDEFQKIIRCFLFPLMNFQNWFVVFYFRWFFQRIQRINEINETNSTNQRIKFSLILRNFNEFSTKISTNQRKFSKNLRIRWNFVRNWSMLWKLPLISHDSLKVWWIYWNLRWKFVNIFTNQRKFYPLIRWIRWWIFKSIFIRWFRFSNQRIQRNQYFFFQRKRINE